MCEDVWLIRERRGGGEEREGEKRLPLIFGLGVFFGGEDCMKHINFACLIFFLVCFLGELRVHF